MEAHNLFVIRFAARPEARKEGTSKAALDFHRSLKSLWLTASVGRNRLRRLTQNFVRVHLRCPYGDTEAWVTVSLVLGSLEF